jgi:hypothetical protein
MEATESRHDGSLACISRRAPGQRQRPEPLHHVPLPSLFRTGASVPVVHVGAEGILALQAKQRRVEAAITGRGAAAPDRRAIGGVKQRWKARVFHQGEGPRR